MKLYFACALQGQLHDLLQKRGVDSRLVSYHFLQKRGQPTAILQALAATGRIPRVQRKPKNEAK